MPAHPRPPRQPVEWSAPSSPHDGQRLIHLSWIRAHDGTTPDAERIHGCRSSVTTSERRAA